jgi:signal transduction histidine kinase/CheY-like chemotaxis protein/HPt (histidine-containing phosphotransfer) domain-containing protein
MLESKDGLDSRQAEIARSRLKLDTDAYNRRNKLLKDFGLVLILLYGALIYCIYRVQKKLRAVAEDLALARDQALQAARIKAEFLANISHEIRTPMNAVIAMSDLLLRTSLADEQREYATIIHKSADALLDLISDILDYSKIEAGKLRLENIEFDVHSVVNGIVELLSGEARAKGLALSTVVDSNLPAAVYGDPVRVRQILLNLTGNGVKFTERGEVSVQTSLMLAAGNAGAIRFSVIDTGIGIDDQQIKNLFQPFIQADGSVTRKYGGTGLGLSISKRLVELMGGELGVESELGKGSTFWFTMPLSTAERTLSERKPVTTSPALAIKSDSDELRRAERISAGTRSLVLVAEDNATNQKVSLLLLRELGYPAHCVHNGQEAVNAMRENHYLLVLMDCQMPVMDGFEATRAIRNMERDGAARTPIIALTAHALPADRERCLASGMDDYLSKPVTADQLAETLNRWTGLEGCQRCAPPAGEPDLTAPEAAAAAADSLPLDLALLEMTYGDKAGPELIASFVSESAELLSQVAKDLERRDLQSFKTKLHQLKGMCVTLYANQLTALIRRIEGSLEAEDWQEIEKDYRSVIESFEQLRRFLKEEYLSPQ